MDDANKVLTAEEERVARALETFINQQMNISDDQLLVLSTLLSGAAFHLGYCCDPRERDTLLKQTNALIKRAFDFGFNNRPVEH